MAPSRRASSQIRSLDPAHITLLIDQGERFMQGGDVAAARVIFQRAAEAGDAGAALALGSTYDPLFLKMMGALGVPPDLERARAWYERAKELGSQEALRRLERIGTK